eukprot:PITA_01747
MMTSLIRSGVGILGSAISLLMYAAPITTFKRVIQKRSTEDFSGFPYAIALFNCLTYMWYGSPLISNGLENIVVLVVNCLGLLLEFCFISIYLTFAPPKVKRTMLRMLVGVFTLFGTVATISFFALHDHKHKKVLVGTTGMVATVTLYGSPLSVIKLVIQTKSVEFMPFSLSLFAFMSSILWLTYGALGKDILIMAPNFLGLALGLVQMVVYCIYRQKKSPKIEDRKLDAGKTQLKENTVEHPACDSEKTKPLPADQDIEMQVKA